MRDDKVICRCPKCGARHALALYWTGRGVPRKYCPGCQHGIDIDGPLDLDEHRGAGADYAGGFVSEPLFDGD